MDALAEWVAQLLSLQNPPHMVLVQVEVIRLNLLLADWDDDDHVESLLAEKNSKWGREYLQNVKCASAHTCISTSPLVSED